MFKNGDVLIQKFGGSSMASVARINRVAGRIAVKAKKGHRLVVVVSAMGDTTDELLQLSKQISTSPNKREQDQMVATGEMISSSLMVMALQQHGIRAKSFNAFNLHLLTEPVDGENMIKEIGRRNNLARFLEPASVAVVAGFQGITEVGDLTTLGRGGSDLTAVVLARELGQKVCEKYTDENGIYSADPRYVSNAVKIWHLDYNEMLGLTNFGSGVLHSRSVLCAKNSDIRIHVRSSFTNEEGTVIGPDGDSSILIKSITSLEFDKDKTIISIVGSGINKIENLRKDCVNFFKSQNIDLFSIEQKKIRLSFCVAKHETMHTLQLLHNFIFKL